MRKMDRGLSVTAAFLVLGLAFLADARPTAPVNAVGPDTQSSDLSAYIQELNSEQSDHQNDDFSGENQIDFNQLDEDFSAEFNQSKHHSPAKLDQLKESPAELGQLKGALPAEQLEDGDLNYDSEKELELEQSHSRQSSPIDSLVRQITRLYKSALSLQAAQAGGRRNEPLSGPHIEDVITEDVFTKDDMTTDELMHHGDDLPSNTDAGGREEPLNGLDSDGVFTEDDLTTDDGDDLPTNTMHDSVISDELADTLKRGKDQTHETSKLGAAVRNRSAAGQPIRRDSESLDNAIGSDGASSDALKPHMDHTANLAKFVADVTRNLKAANKHIKLASEGLNDVISANSTPSDALDDYLHPTDDDVEFVATTRNHQATSQPIRHADDDLENANSVDDTSLNAFQQGIDHIASPASQPMRPDGDDYDGTNSVDDTSSDASEQDMDHIAAPASRPIRPDGDNFGNAISINGE